MTILFCRCTCRHYCKETIVWVPSCGEKGHKKTSQQLDHSHQNQFCGGSALYDTSQEILRDE